MFELNRFNIVTKTLCETQGPDLFLMNDYQLSIKSKQRKICVMAKIFFIFFASKNRLKYRLKYRLESIKPIAIWIRVGLVN